jgi:hypothetical protein
VLKELNNFSGHYKPDVEQFGMMQKHLKDQNVNMDVVEARAVTPMYRPEDKQKLKQVIVEFDMTTGKAIEFHVRAEVNAGGPVVNGVKLSERVAANDERYTKVPEQHRSLLEVVTNSAGELVYKADPTKKLDTQGSNGLFVMDAEGRIFASDANKRDPGFTHASFLDGAPVRLAGQIEVKDGKLIHIDNKSPEYASSKEQLMESMKVLVNKNVDTSSARGYQQWEPHFVENPDGSKRAVLLQIRQDNKVADIEDPGPPPAASSSGAMPGKGPQSYLRSDLRLAA